jgi:hypothetical protein
MKEAKFVQLFLFAIVTLFFFENAQGQYKEFKISAKGDTINAITQKGVKQGKWVIRVPELRGEPGYDEEGLFKNGAKEGVWRRYTLEGDLVAVENYKRGGKHGLQQYYTPVGELLLEENWRGYDPDAPYDTIAVSGTESNEVIEFKIVKAEQYSVKQGEWKYYDPATGRIIRSEQWERNVLVNPNAPKPVVAATGEKKKVEKTAEMLEWEKKNRGKKGAIRDGKTGL